MFRGFFVKSRVRVVCLGKEIRRQRVIQCQSVLLFFEYCEKIESVNFISLYAFVCYLSFRFFLRFVLIVFIIFKDLILLNKEDKYIEIWKVFVDFVFWRVCVFVRVCEVCWFQNSVFVCGERCIIYFIWDRRLEVLFLGFFWFWVIYLGF